MKGRNKFKTPWRGSKPPAQGRAKRHPGLSRRAYNPSPHRGKGRTTSKGISVIAATCGWFFCPCKALFLCVVRDTKGAIPLRSILPWAGGFCPFRAFPSPKQGNRINIPFPQHLTINFEHPTFQGSSLGRTPWYTGFYPVLNYVTPSLRRHPVKNALP